MMLSHLQHSMLVLLVALAICVDHYVIFSHRTHFSASARLHFLITGAFLFFPIVSVFVIKILF